MMQTGTTHRQKGPCCCFVFQKNAFRLSRKQKGIQPSGCSYLRLLLSPVAALPLCREYILPLRFRSMQSSYCPPEGLCSRRALLMAQICLVFARKLRDRPVLCWGASSTTGASVCSLCLCGSLFFLKLSAPAHTSGCHWRLHVLLCYCICGRTSVHL